MALVSVTNIIVEDNPCPFLSPLKLKITFECVKDIEEEIDWELIYIGSAKDEKYDQNLDSFSMGPLTAGIMQFVLETNPPDYKKIPTKDDLLGVTAIVLSVRFRKKEFFRCGYYVYNSYTDQSLLENEPEEIIIEKIQRNILADKPRITRFAIDWGMGIEKQEENNTITENEVQNSEHYLQDKTNLGEGKASLVRDLEKKMGISSNIESISNPFLDN